MERIELGCGAILRETTVEENDGGSKQEGYIYITLENGSGCIRTKMYNEEKYTTCWHSEAQVILHRSALPGLLTAINTLMQEDIARQDAE